VTDWAWLLPALPALAAVVGLFAWRQIPGGAAVPAIGGAAGALVVAIALVTAVGGDPGVARESSVDWTPIGGVDLAVGTRVDGLAAVVAVMVCVVGLLVQVYSTAYMAGDRRYPTYAAEVSLFTAAMLLVVVASALLLLCGVVGKSAQFPLHVWLPDAMAGPTPITALIHAATMDAAGIYVVARLDPVYVASPVALTVLGVIACITMLGAALAALAEDDLKRVLAWSTVSQLAYMAAGLAVGGWTASVWHLLTHAAFKALLFLAAGSVLRTVGTNLMSEMGGLRRAMPITFVTALVGAAALAGLPPFAGAFSKDGILAAARDHGGGLGTAVYVVGLVTVFVTAAYVTRLVLRTFFGDYRGQKRLFESPMVMTMPLVLLAIAAIGLGLPVLPSSYGVESWLGVPAGAEPLEVGVAGVVVTGLVALAGVLAVWLLHRRRPAADPIDVLGAAATPLRHAFWVDDLYDHALVRPARALARVVLDTDRRAIDGTVVTTGRLTSALGGGLRLAQNGNVQAYLSAFVLGVLVVMAVVSMAVVM
jgi:NADH-quinone oxidoreductase subunit L